MLFKKKNEFRPDKTHSGALSKLYITKKQRAALLKWLLMALVMVALSGVFPMIYNTSDSVRSLAGSLICISACFMPFNAYVHSVYFAMRSGGKTMITFLFDSGFMWCASVPLAICLSRFTTLPILPLYALCLSMDLIKCLIGNLLIRGNSWMKNLTQ